MSSPVRYGSGPGSDPHEGPGGRQGEPFGPEISWPYGFRQMDTGSREELESAYGTGPGYQQPAVDDYGYGDPGYADPSYEGPRAPHGGSAFGGPAFGGPAFGGQNGGPRNAAAPRAGGGSGYRPADTGVPGYHVPEVRDSARPGYASPGYQPQGFAPPSGGQEIWPVTGAQEALPDTGPQPAAPGWGARGSGGSPQAASPAYPDQWYDNPRLNDRVLDDVPRDQPRPGGSWLDGPRLDGPSAGSRPVDPRLAGMNYGELRYDEPAPGQPGFDGPLDDASWSDELRRSDPAYPKGFGPQHPSGPQRRVEPQAPGYGQQPGFPQAPDRTAGYDKPRGDRGGSFPQVPQGPQMSAGRMTGPGQRAGSQPGSPFPPGPAAQGTGFLSAPTAPVGLLTPPEGTRVDALRDGASPAAPTASPSPRPGSAATQVMTAPSATRRGTSTGTATVRPGHGLDGPEITSSWPIQPQTDDLESFQDFWRDDEDEEYTGLFGDRQAEFDRADARQAAASRQVAAKRRIGRRRGGSNDHRLWLALGGVVIVAAAAITGIIKFEFPSHGGPAHTMVTPAKIGTYARTVDLERQVGLSQLRAEVIKMSSGQASDVVSAVYESGNSAAGNTEQILMFIGGHLANADPAASISSFTQEFRGAHVVSAGVLGGKAACVQEGTTASNSRSLCAWFDNDSFGEIVSPTMNATALANAMRTVRPSVELLAKK